MVRVSSSYYSQKGVDTILNCNFDQEIYYRGIRYFNRQLFNAHKAKKGGSTLPGAPRQSERIKIPGLSKSNDLFAFFIGCTIISYENDYATSEILNHSIRMAQRYQFSGKWKIWQDFINYFDIKEEFDYTKNINEIETCFDLVAIFDFLELHYSADEIFGNLLKRSVKLISNLYKVENRYKLDRRRVRYPQRKRGYTDKGSLAPFDSRARREANLRSDNRDRRVFDSISQVQLWGKLPTEED